MKFLATICYIDGLKQLTKKLCLHLRERFQEEAAPVGRDDLGILDGPDVVPARPQSL